MSEGATTPGIAQPGSVEAALPETGDWGASLSEQQKTNLVALNQALYKLWRLGRYILVGWCRDDDGICVLAVPYYQLADLLQVSGDNPGATPGRMDLIRESRMLDPHRLRDLCGEIDAPPVPVPLPNPGTESLLPPAVINGLMRRYSITQAENRAVALFDIVGFSLYTPFEQTTLLQSLAYSINASHAKLRDHRFRVEFARTTTGDGFYIWNRDASIEGNIHLYHLMHLVLADNAIARTRSHGHTAPELKTAFHVGSFYEFYQAESLSPTRYNYIVGDVTVELARMVEGAVAGQVLVGDFHSLIPAGDAESGSMVEVNTTSFIELLQDRLNELEGLVLSGEGIDAIKCYLTGAPRGDKFTISRYQLTDKHGIARVVYNAKVNIYREDREPIFLGLREQEASSGDVRRIEAVQQELWSR